MHAPVQAALGMQAVEHGGVDGDCNELNDDLNQAADEGPILRGRLSARMCCAGIAR